MNDADLRIPRLKVVGVSTSFKSAHKILRPGSDETLAIH